MTATVRYVEHRPLATMIAETFQQKCRKLLWWSVPRRDEPRWANDRRMARETKAGGSDWRLEPGGNCYDNYWIILRDGTEIARARSRIVAQQTVARAVGAQMGG